MFTNPELSPLYQAMGGLNRDKPFECTGTEDEVRSAIQAAAQHGGNLPALTLCIRNSAITNARPLDILLKGWGQDDLIPPALKERVRRAASL